MEEGDKVSGLTRLYVEGKAVNIKKDFFGYRIIHPNKNDDGSINWPNFLFGGWRNLAALIFIVIVISGIVYGIDDILDQCQQLAEDPCRYVDCNPYSPTNTYHINLNQDSLDKVLFSSNKK